MDEISVLSTEVTSPDQLENILYHLSNWEKASFDDRRMVLDGLVTVIRASEQGTEIRWKI